MADVQEKHVLAAVTMAGKVWLASRCGEGGECFLDGL